MKAKKKIYRNGGNLPKLNYPAPQYLNGMNIPQYPTGGHIQTQTPNTGFYGDVSSELNTPVEDNNINKMQGIYDTEVQRQQDEKKLGQQSQQIGQMVSGPYGAVAVGAGNALDSTETDAGLIAGSIISPDAVTVATQSYDQIADGNWGRAAANIFSAGASEKIRNKNENKTNRANLIAEQNRVAENQITQLKDQQEQQRMDNYYNYIGMDTKEANEPRIFAMGGRFPKLQGGGPMVTEYNGNTHEQMAPNGQTGITLGEPGMAEVEDKETSVDDYVFSDRLKPRGSKKSYADLSKDIKKKQELRPNDPISKKTADKKLSELQIQQEEQRQFMMNNVYEKAYGGSLKYGEGGDKKNPRQMNPKLYKDFVRQYEGNPNHPSLWGMSQFSPDYTPKKEDMPAEIQAMLDYYNSQKGFKETAAIRNNYLVNPIEPKGTGAMPELRGGGYIPKYTHGGSYVGGNSTENNSGISGNQVMQYASPIFNTYQALRPIDKTEAVYNPFESDALSSIGDSRDILSTAAEEIDASKGFDNSEQIKAIQRATRASNRDASNISSRMSQFSHKTANYLAGARHEAREHERAEQIRKQQEARAAQMRMGLAGQEAGLGQMQYGIGAGRQGEDIRVQTADQMAEAARRGYASQAATDTSSIGQRNILMENQRANDQLRMQYAGDYGKYMQMVAMLTPEQKKQLGI